MSLIASVDSKLCLVNVIKILLSDEKHFPIQNSTLIDSFELLADLFST